MYTIISQAICIVKEHPTRFSMCCSLPLHYVNACTGGLGRHALMDH